MVIRRVKPLGFSIDEMRGLLLAVIHDLAERSLPDDPRQILQDRLAAFTAATRDRRERLRVQLAMADEFLGRLENL